MCGCLLGDLACNPGLCPDWEANWWPFDSQAHAQSTELHQLGLFLFILLQLSQFSPFALLCPAHPQFHSQHPHCCSCPWVSHTCSLTNPFPLFQTVPTSLCPSYYCQPIPWFYPSCFILLISLICSLNLSYKWGHMVFVFYWLAYFT